MRLIKEVICSILSLLIMSSICLAEDLKLSNMVNNFNWKFFDTVNRDENIFYSPYSITTALSIVANGSEGQTREELLKLLSSNSLENINSAHYNFNKNIENDYKIDGRKFLESNLILINKNCAGNGINGSYRKTVEDLYMSTIREADFNNNLDVEKQNISKWVADKTNNFIPNYNPIVTVNTILDILNVVYFKGDWEIPFKGYYTSEDFFSNKDNSKLKVKMMNQSFNNRIKYYENDKYKAIELPYKKDDFKITVAAMYLILPVNSSELDIADDWNNESLEYKNQFLENIRKAPTFYGNIYVKLPKFELDIENKIVDNLKSIGIQRAFTNDAEFFQMVNNASLKIDNVNHRAKVKVDETGTEAAAITEIGIRATSTGPMPAPIKNFCADRPFLFMIADVESGVELFTGVVNKL